MIQVTIIRDVEKQVKEITCKGHAGYAASGQDIICAAVSALTLNMANSVEAFTGDSFEGEMDEETGGFSFRFTGSVSRESRLLIDSLVLGLTSIQESYGKKYIHIRYKEV